MKDFRRGLRGQMSEIQALGGKIWDLGARNQSKKGVKVVFLGSEGVDK